MLCFQIWSFLFYMLYLHVWYFFYAFSLNLSFFICYCFNWAKKPCLCFIFRSNFFGSTPFLNTITLPHKSYKKYWLRSSSKLVVVENIFENWDNSKWVKWYWHELSFKNNHLLKFGGNPKCSNYKERPRCGTFRLFIYFFDL
jgi:hypothetical protein